MPKQEHPVSWPKEEGCVSIVINFFEKASDKKSVRTYVLDTDEQKKSFFKELNKLNPQGGGLMVSFSPEVSDVVSIIFNYTDGSRDIVDIYGGHVKSTDTSFYTDEDDRAKEKEFISYLNGFQE
jgi:hypothetical protein